MASDTDNAAAGAADVAHAAADMAHEAAAGPGMPQLDFSTFGNQIFWLVVTLVVIYLVLTRIALPRIAGVLADRQGAITSDIAAAEDLRQKAIEAENAYDQALADARVKAQAIIAEAKAEIQADLDDAAAKADAEIAARTAESEKAINAIRDSAVASVKEVARDAANEIVSTMGFSADAKAVTAAVNARMKG